MRPLNRFEAISILRPANITAEDITVTISSKYVQPYAIEFTDTYYIELSETEIRIHPDMMWLSGFEVLVEVGGVQYTYLVAEDIYFYAPEQYLYSNNLLASPDIYAELLKVGMIAPEEKELLTNLGPKVDTHLLNLSKCVVGEFVYDGNKGVDACTKLRGFRRFQQLLYMLGLDSIIEYYLFTPGPSGHWFRQAEIDGTFVDKEAAEKALGVEAESARVYGAMQSLDLNVMVVDAVGLHLDPKSFLFPLIKAIVILSIALRYTNDNPKFNY